MVGFAMRFVLVVLLVVAVVGSSAVLLLVLGAFSDPTNSLFAVIGTTVWATWGPFLLLFALVAVLVGIAGQRARIGRLGGVALLVAVPALASATDILARIVLAAGSAGASLDPLPPLRSGTSRLRLRTRSRQWKVSAALRSGPPSIAQPPQPSPRRSLSTSMAAGSAPAHSPKPLPICAGSPTRG